MTIRPHPLLADLMAAAFREDRPGIRAVLGALTDTERRQFAYVIRIIVEEQVHYRLDARDARMAEAEIISDTVLREHSGPVAQVDAAEAITHAARHDVIGIALEDSIADPFTGKATVRMRLGDPNPDLEAALGPHVAPFTCPRCHMTSYHPKDAEHGYCGNCHAFTRSPS
jgi:hypothetical protein